MTRALVSLLKLDFAMAMYYHPLVFFCLPAFPSLLAVHIKKERVAKRILVTVFVVVFVAVYLYRMLIVKSTVLHFSPENGVFVKMFLYCFS